MNGGQTEREESGRAELLTTADGRAVRGRRDGETGVCVISEV